MPDCIATEWPSYQTDLCSAADRLFFGFERIAADLENFVAVLRSLAVAPDGLFADLENFVAVLHSLVVVASDCLFADHGNFVAVLHSQAVVASDCLFAETACSGAEPAKGWARKQ